MLGGVGDAYQRPEQWGWHMIKLKAVRSCEERLVSLADGYWKLWGLNVGGR